MSLITEVQELRRRNRELAETVQQQDLKISELERALTDAMTTQFQGHAGQDARRRAQPLVKKERL